MQSNHFQKVKRMACGVLKRKTVQQVGSLFVLAGITASALHADNFVKPTKEELEMTALADYPGTPAVVLFREDITKDDLHVMQRYERVKILTEDGKKYANVELPFISTTSSGDYTADDKTVGDIVGRTIHPDGTVIPFTGKPYLKVIEQIKGFKVQQRVFTLPDVTVGSIIEYRYATRYNDNVYESPDWYIQGELFVKSAHYQWYPTTRQMTNEDGAAVNSISWYPILPVGTKLERKDLPRGTFGDGPIQMYEVNVNDVPPKQHEEFMPPIGSFSYRVLFNFTPYRSQDDYWKSEGKRWSKKADSFIGPNSDVRDATKKIIEGAKNQDEKLQKIYAAVMELENTEYTRERNRQEDKAAGLGVVKNTSDVLSHKRGTPSQLTELFVSMARAADMKAYLMLVPDRSQELFTPMWMNFRQFDDTVAIVNVDGKDRFYDPGQRYCPYGNLAWQDTFDNGLRQVDGGVTFAQTPGDRYTSNKIGRVADLAMDEHGAITGSVELTMKGSQALYWRQAALKGDSESTEHNFTESIEKMLPGTLEVKFKDAKNLQDYEKPLVVSFDVKGTLGTATGKRLVVPVDLFRSGSTATFPHEKRELAVYFHYPVAEQEALRITFPKNMTLEATPDPSKFMFGKSAIYNLQVTVAPTNVTVRRDLFFDDVMVPKDEYGALRTFYSQFEAKDQDSVVFKLVPVEASASPAPTGN